MRPFQFRIITVNAITSRQLSGIDGRLPRFLISYRLQPGFSVFSYEKVDKSDLNDAISVKIRNRVIDVNKKG